MAYKHNERTRYDGAISSTKTYVLLVLVVTAGFVAEMAFLGPSKPMTANSSQRGNAETVAVTPPNISVSTEPANTLSKINVDNDQDTVVASNNTGQGDQKQRTNLRPLQQGNNASPALQGGEDTLDDKDKKDKKQRDWRSALLHWLHLR